LLRKLLKNVVENPLCVVFKIMKRERIGQIINFTL